MDAQAMLDLAMRAARQRKEDGCRRYGDLDIAPQLEVWRDGRLVAAVICPEVDKMQALASAEIAVPGFGADALTLTVDAHVAESPVNPNTAKPWAPGEMQRACDEEGACDLGVITDCLLTLLMRRDGSSQSLTCRYRVDKQAGRVLWLGSPDKSPTDGNMRHGGLVPDTLRDCFRLPLFWDRLAALAVVSGLTEQAARGHLVYATCSAIATRVPGAMIVLARQETHQVAGTFATQRQTPR